MATATARRVIEIDVTTSKGLQQGIRQVNSQLRSIEGNAAKTSREVRRMGSNFNFMALAAKAFIAIRVAKFVSDMSDSMILLGARINIVTEETVGVEKAFTDLFEIANKTRQSIDATGTLYARLGFSTKTLGLEHEELLKIVQGVNNTLLLSGSSAQESASSIIQLSQAFSKGALDGDEFRSVSEGNVVLFGAMQEVLGKTAGELRQFSRDGKLTADLMAQVLTSEQVQGLQSRVDEIPLTFAQAFTKIKNALSAMTIELEPLFTTIASWFDDLAKGFSADVTIGKGFSEGIISFKEFMLEGNGSLEQRLELARKVNIEFDNMFQRQERHRQDVKLGIDDERFRLNQTRERIRVLETGLINPNNILNNWKKFNEITVTAAEKEVAVIEEKIIKETQYGLEQQRIITRAIEKAKLDEAALKITIQAGKEFEAQQKRFEEIKMSIRTPSQELNDSLDELLRLKNMGFDENVLDAAATESMVKYSEAIDKASKSMTEAEQNSIALGVAIGNSLGRGVEQVGDALFDYMIGLETSFKATITSILEDIARLIVQITLLNALKAGLSDTPLGSFLWPTASANGNVFNQGRIQPFATGGVVDSPVLFPMANGTGLMGEAGPEAILPLKRGPDGKLGVTAESGGAAKNVSVSIENKGSTDSQVVSSTATTDINGTVISIILDDFRRGGPLHGSIRNLR